MLKSLVKEMQGGELKSLLKVKTNAFDWKSVAGNIPGRTVKQMRERWLNFCDPALNMGPWTPEEDARLLVAAKTYNNSWTRVAAAMEGRTTNRVKTRWKALFRMDQRRKPWTAHEDVIILDGRRKGLSWGQVSTCLPYRCTKIIRTRFMQLMDAGMGSLELAASEALSRYTAN